jgi:hypothetical protein
MNTADRDFSAWTANVLQPVVNGAEDKDALAVFLNRQLDEWDLEAMRPEGQPWAPLVVNAIEWALKR